MDTLSRPIEYLLSGISSTSTIITRFIRSVRVAHADLAAVTRDLSDLRLLLELMREERGIPVLLQAQTLQLLWCCGNVLIHIDTILAQCSDTEKWISTGRAEMASCRDSLETFGEALGLALEVATLPSLQNNPAESSAVEDNITSEVQRLQTVTESARHFHREAGSTLFHYLSAVSTCTQRSSSNTPREEGAGLKTIPTPPPQQNTGPEQAIERTQLEREAQSSILADTNSHFLMGKHFAEAWSPFTHTSGPTAPPFAQQQKQPSPGLPESPTLPPRQGEPLATSQEHLPTSVAQPPKQLSGSPPASPPASSAKPRWAISSNFKPSSFPADPWSDPIQNSPPQGSSPRNASRVIPFAETLIDQGGSTPGTRSSFRNSLQKCPVFDQPSGSVSPAYPSRLSAVSPFLPSPFTPRPLSPPPEYRRTPTPTISQEAGSSANRQLIMPVPARLNLYQPTIEIVPIRHLMDKGKSKASEILHIDTSPASGYIATKHTNKTVKIWSITKNALHGTIKITSYVQPRVRSREYFIQSHAILSENVDLIGITTHFGLTLEIYNFLKGGSSAKKVQVIEEAHRWAASPRNAYQNDYAPLAVYRPKGDRIDRYFLARYANAKHPFVEDASHSIELLKADLPFIPKFPELAYSSDSPYLIAAAGPRPGDPPRTLATILIAWHMRPVSESKLHCQNQGFSRTSLPEENRHLPYRVCVPEYPALQTALPACLVSSGSTAVSIWIPAATTGTSKPETPTEAKRSFTFPRSATFPSQPLRLSNPATHPSSTTASERYVLSWDLPTNTTRIFSIPNVQSCVSPNCRLLAYCDPGPSSPNPMTVNTNSPNNSASPTSSGTGTGQFVVIDIPTARELYRWPPPSPSPSPSSSTSSQAFTAFGPSQQLPNLSSLTVFEFSPDGRTLVIGDTNGAVGVYEIRERRPPGPKEGVFELGDGSEVAAVEREECFFGSVLGRLGERGGGGGGGNGTGFGNGIGIGTGNGCKIEKGEGKGGTIAELGS